MSNQELGDAVYRDNGIDWDNIFFDQEYEHAAIYTGLDANGADTIIHVLGNGVPTMAKGSFSWPSQGSIYHGAYNTGGINGLANISRNNIVASAESILANDANIGYTFADALDYGGLSWHGDVSEIANLRCDGLVEYSYEKEGLSVWGKDGANFNITSSAAICDEHNDMPDCLSCGILGFIYTDYSYELSPKAQRGGYDNMIAISPSTYNNTYMQSSVPRSPTNSYSIISGTAGANGWYTSDVAVRLLSTDESGIYKIAHKIGTGGVYTSTYTATVDITLASSGTIYYYGVDKAGNYPANANSFSLNIDKSLPTVPGSLTAGVASSNQINLSWSASIDSGGSALAGYKIERCTGSGCSNFSQIGTSSANSYSDTGLNATISYSYRVRAYDNAGNHGGYSNTISATTYAGTTVTTSSATSIGQTGATLNGSVNPNGSSTTGYFQYGTTTAYGSSTTSQSEGAGTSNVALTQTVTGLMCGTLYHYRAVGVSSSGTTNGNDTTFTTSTCTSTPPTVTTSSATSIGQTGATLNGTVNAKNTSTTVTFQYGMTTSYGTTTTALQSPVAGGTNTSVSVVLGGLIANTTYHFRVVGTNAGGTSNGGDLMFTTAASGAGVLSINPATPAAFAGTQGGPFSPSSVTYTLSNTGGASINWTASSGSWYTVTPTNGSLSAGANTQVTVSINNSANSLAAGAWQGTVSIANTTNGSGNATRTVDLTITNSVTIAIPIAVDQPSWIITHGGNANWTGQASTTHDGVNAAKSGLITNSQLTSFQTTVSGAGSGSFWRKVSSEAGYDYLSFYVDGVAQGGSISGEVDWTQVNYTVTGAGNHILLWEYTKDGSVSNGSDAGWVDQVVWTPTSQSTANFNINSPNGGEYLQAGTSVAITWGGNVSYPYVDIHLYKNGSYNSTIANGVNNNGNYMWDIPTYFYPGADYQVKIIASSNTAFTDLSDDFFTVYSVPPPAAFNEDPYDGTNGLPINTTLTWLDGGGATSYDIYMGSYPWNLSFKGNQSGNTFNPGTLNYNTTYYWRVDSKSSGGTTTGNTWAFTTEAAPELLISTSDLNLETNLTGTTFSRTFTVRNNGHAILSGHLSQSADWFSISPSYTFALSAGEEKTYTVSGTFPMSSGPFTTNITFVSNGGSQEISVHGVAEIVVRWTKANSPFILTQNELVESGVRLIIEPGTVVKFEPGHSLWVEGTLIANGTTAQPITFTSNKTTPAAGDWEEIHFSNNSTDAAIDANNNYVSGSILSHVVVEYGKGVLIENSYPYVANNTIRNNSGTNNPNGCCLPSGVLTFQYTTSDSGKTLVVQNNIVENNTGTGIGGGNYSMGMSGSTPTFLIQYNTIRDNNGSGVTCNSGHLLLSDNEIYHNGQGVYSYSADNGDIIEHNVIANNTGYAYGGYGGSSPTVRYNSIVNNGMQANPLMMPMYGMSTINPADAIITDNTILNNRGGYTFSYEYWPNPVINNNNIVNPSNTYEVYIPSTTAMNIPNNWWGTTDAAVIGTRIYDYYDDFYRGKVTYSPVLNTWNTAAPISPPSGVTITQGTAGSVNVSWNANPESDVAGYKVYWGTEPGYQYANVVDVGNATNYLVTGLTGSTYSVVVTAYDVDAASVVDNPNTLVNEKQTSGHESWFALPLFDLTVIKAGPGSGTASGNGSYEYGMTANVTASPDPGSFFAGWSGDCSGNMNQTSVTMNGNKTCTATFTLMPIYYSLTASISGTGMGMVSGSGMFMEGAITSVFAMPYPGSIFTGWSGDCSGTTSPATVVVDNNKSCTANFAMATTYSLMVNTAGTGNGMVMGDGMYNEGAVATITALPYSGSTFSGWSGDCSGIVSTTTITMDSNKFCTATFSIVTGSISGVVSDDSLPANRLAGVPVFACIDNTNCVSTLTGPDGSYSLPNLSYGMYTLTAGGKGSLFAQAYFPNSTHSPFTAGWVYMNGVDVQGIDFNLQHGGVVSGVISGATDTVLAGIRVQACTMMNDCGDAVTNALGQYAITVLPDSYTIYADAYGTPYVGEFYDNAYDRNSSTVVAVSLGNSAAASMTLDLPGSITGKIRDSVTGQGIMGISVIACTPSGFTCNGAMSDMNGDYTIIGLVPAAHQIYANGNGSFVGRYHGNVYDAGLSTLVSVVSGNIVSGINVDLQIGGSITGVVTAADTGSILFGVWVSACTSSGPGNCFSAVTDIDGRYTISGLSTGNYNLFADGYGTYIGEFYTSSGGTQNLTSAEPVPVTIATETTAKNFVLDIGGSITGIVSSASGAVSWQLIYACGTSGGPCWGAQSNYDGTYTISGLVTGTYTVYTSGSGIYSAQYYNGVVDQAAATLVSVIQGQNTASINFMLTELPSSYVISASAGSHGSITPSGAVSVPIWGVQMFTIMPDAGCHVTDVFVDGVSIGAADYYMFAGVSSNHTISASFEPGVYTVTGISMGNGTITPPTQSLVSGSTATLNLIADSGYKIGTVESTCGGSRVATLFTTGPVTANCTVTASFIPNSLAVLIAGTGSGTVTGAGNYNYNDRAIVTATANSGSSFARWDGDCTGIISTTTITMNGSKTCTATFDDISGPAMTLSMLPDKAVTSNPVLNIAGSVTDPNGVKYITINGIAVNASGAVFSKALLLSNSTNTVTITSTDILDNQTIETRTIIYDFTAPGLDITNLPDNSVVFNNVIELNGTIADPASIVNVRVNSSAPQAAVISSQTWTSAVILASGINTIEVIATDTINRTNRLKRTVILDTLGAAVSIFQPEQDSVVSASNVAIKGMIADAPTGAFITIDCNAQTYTPGLTNGVFDQVVSLSTETSYPIVVTVRDNGGNALTTLQRNLIYKKMSVALAPDKSSPHVLSGAGTIAFTAQTSGGSGNYEYKFWLKTDGVWNIVQDYSPANAWMWSTMGVAAGSYDVLVYVRNAGSSATYETLNSLSYVLLANSPATGAILTPDIASPQMIGNNITFTAGGIGGKGDYEYKFWLKTGGVWSITRDYSAANTWEWSTTSLAAGSYDVLVYVRNTGSSAAYEAKASLSYVLVSNPPATGVTLNPSIVSPQIIGNNVTFTAGGVGGSGNYEYKFWLKTGGVWAEVQAYSLTNAWTWNTIGSPAGSYEVEVYVRNIGSIAAYEALNSLTYALVASTPATDATLIPSLSSPQAIGNHTITFTAGGMGGSGNYEYKFWLKTGGVWTEVQQYSLTNTWIWNTNGAEAGTYGVQVYVRNVGSSAKYEAVKNLSYILSVTGPATDASLTSDVASPQIIGNNPTFTAGGVGGSGSYEYKFWLKTNGVWAMVRDYSKTNTWTWNTSATLAGTYGVQVQVRNAGSSAKYEAVKTMSYVLAPPPVSGATLVPDKASPQTAGANVTFTAGGVGGSGNYEYKFWIKAAGIWTVVQDYSTTNTYSWNTTGLTPGTYRAQVYVRNVGSTAKYEAVLGMGYVVK